ncbi:MAG: cell division protein FtsQ/DivIB [Deltaproteobacteria bacterium]
MLLTLVILAVPTAVYAWGRTSSSFGIETIRVSGTNLVPEKRALRLLREDYTGRNLFAVTGGDVRRTLAPLCFVRGASIDRDFPETLAVTLTEYVPAAYALAGDRWYVVDREGYVICSAAEAADQFAKKPAKKPSSSPTASADAAAEADAAAAAQDPAEDAGGDSAQAGSILERLLAGPGKAALALPRMAVAGKVRQGRVVSDKAAAEMLTVIAALPRSLQRSLTAVQNDDGQLTLRFADGPVTTWGDAERTLAKTVALRTVLRQYADAGKTCTQMDVSIPDRTLARPVLQ